jgi:Glycosyl transferase family 2
VRLVLTVLARDEADVIDAQIAFHLNAGVDFVVATDNRSQDGTTEILESYAEAGCLRLIHERREGLRQGEWVTRMARLAATEHGADWVINSDADEFWWPRGSSLKDVFAAVPTRYGVVQSFWRSFVPRPDDGAFFAERMTARLSQHAPINDPTSFYRPVKKVAHRADANVVVGRGNHGLVGSALAPLPSWHPVEVLHFPLRSRAQWMRKVELQGEAFTKHIERAGTGYHLKGYDALQSGRIEQHLASLVVDDDRVTQGLADGTVVIDTRPRDALRELRLRAPVNGVRQFALPSERGSGLAFEPPSVADDAQYAMEAAVLGEADVVRVQRRVDVFEERLRQLERRRVRRLARLARR